MSDAKQPQQLPGDEPCDKRIEAYAAAEKRLALQDATLSNTRTRASALLATAAVFTAFSAGVGLMNTDPGRGAVFSQTAARVLFVLVIGLGATVLYVMWPTKNWCFTPSRGRFRRGGEIYCGRTADEDPPPSSKCHPKAL